MSNRTSDDDDPVSKALHRVTHAEELLDAEWDRSQRSIGEHLTVYALRAVRFYLESKTDR
jgi:hypothetical protein